MMTFTIRFGRRYRRALTGWMLAVLVAAPLVLLTRPAVAAAAAQPEAAASPASAPEDGGVTGTIAKIVNFALLVGTLVYFLRAPLAQYLTSRGDTIRKDLVDAKALRASAAERLREIEARRATLPAELDELRARGREELARERQRLKDATAREREKVLETTRREIEAELRNARRALVTHTAERAMELAEARIAASMTAEDQARLVDRYVGEVRP